MKQILTATTLVAGISLATTTASAQYDVGSEIARGVINGIILGGRVGPDFYGMERLFFSQSFQELISVGQNHRQPVGQELAASSPAMLGAVCLLDPYISSPSLATTNQTRPLVD
jgi:hypothetical protein